MNFYHWAAVALAAVAAVLAYLGQKHESARQARRTESQLTAIAGDLQALKETKAPVSPEQLAEVENRYLEVAERFSRDKPLLAARLAAERSAREAAEIQASAGTHGLVRTLSRELKAAITAFSTHTANWQLVESAPPPNTVGREILFARLGLNSADTHYAVSLHVEDAMTPTLRIARVSGQISAPFAGAMANMFRHNPHYFAIMLLPSNSAPPVYRLVADGADAPAVVSIFKSNANFGLPNEDGTFTFPPEDLERCTVELVLAILQHDLLPIEQ